MANIRECFKSRSDNGLLIEADYSQLEIIALAYITQDAQLYKDLRSGTDLHAIRASEMFGIPLAYMLRDITAGNPSAINCRKIAKAFSFQLQYGAGYKSIAESLDIDETRAKEFIEIYYNRYPAIKLWQDNMIASVQAGRVKSDKRTTKGFPAGTSTIESITGRRYTFQEYDSPDWMRKDTSFSPTQIKNYPIQGFATGDIVPMMIGELYHELALNNNLKEDLLMVNTIHDSVVFDLLDRTKLVDAAEFIKDIMENAPAYLKANLDIDFDLPLNVEISAGKTWLSLEKVL